MIANDLNPGVAVLDPPVPAFALLVQSATLEFHAALQLLAERARFLTAADGVAIAVETEGTFVYSASAGDAVSAIDGKADHQRAAVREAIASLKPVSAKQERSFFLLVPIADDRKVSGFFELVSGRAFNQQEISSITRLAALAYTALDLRDGAQLAESKIQEAAQEKPSVPKLWHAPVETAKEPTPDVPSTEASPATLAEKCWWCGFPVSSGRKLCVECEEKNLASIPHTEKPMFEFGEQEGWMDRYGYTIATALVSVLAAVLIYLLR